MKKIRQMFSFREKKIIKESQRDLTRRLLRHELFKLNIMRCFPLYLVLFISLFGHSVGIGQTACELNYKIQCEEEIRLLSEKKAIECRLADIHNRKQELIACVSAEKNRVELDAIKRVLTQTLETVSNIQSKPMVIPKICPTGNCN